MKCFRCGSDMFETTTTDVTDVDNCLIVVRHVPCEECSQCGEIYYNGMTIKKLEHITDLAKSIANEITVVDFSKNVA